MSEEKVIAAAGSTTRVVFNANNSNAGGGENGENGSGATAGDGTETPEAKAARLLEEKEFEGLSAEEITAKKEEKRIAAEEAKKNELPELNDAQILALMKKQFGDDWDGDIEAAKGKLKKTIPELSAEEKAKAEALHEKRMLDLYVEEGGTAEQFYQLKQIKEADLTVFGVEELKIGLKKKGFDDGEIAEILTERYYQINPDELTQDENETSESFEKRKAAVAKKAAYGKEKFESLGKATKAKAERFFNDLDEAIKAKDLQVKEDEAFTAEVEANSKKLPRKMTLELGKVDNVDLPLVHSDVPDDVIAKVTGIVKDKNQIKQLLFKQDGTLNSEKILDLLVKEEMLSKVARDSLFAGETKATEEFEKRFPYRNAHSVGVGGGASPSRNSGGKTVAGFGNPQRVRAGQS